MTVLGIHATGREVAERILASGFRPGTSLANYLGEGVYFYLVHGDRGYQNAVQCAEAVARRRYDRVAVLAAKLSVDCALNLQNPSIRPIFAAFGAAFDRRLSRLGVRVEPNDNASYYRPVSHLTIEAFRRCLEAVSNRAFDVLSARFALKSRDIDVELPHEICVKRSRAILSVAACRPGVETASASSDPASWPCADDMVQAAERAVWAVSAMDDQDLFDLILSIYQGSDGCWAVSRARFAGFGPVHVLYDSRRYSSEAEVLRSIAEIGRGQPNSVQFLDLAQAAQASTPRAQALLGGVIEKTAGLLALHTPADAELVSLLVSVAERRPEVPILTLMGPGGQGHGDADVPIMMRSRHNLCCINLPPLDKLGGVIAGFLHDRWTDGLAVLDIESKMAARHGSVEVRHRDARRIVEAYLARQRDLL